ncbi:MAG: TonB-dependent receptor [Alcaligenaceae bacterium]|nr:TonB-dependent receptor [Alcaligenaceae bacterium]
MRPVYAVTLLGLAFSVQAQQQGNVKQMETVVVTASGFEQVVRDAPASITVITREELEKKPFKNLGEAVEDVEGVSVERGGKTGGMNISMRGLGPDYTLILVDGKRVNRNSSGSRPNGFGDVDTSFIPPLSAIERIEVVRGPMSTLYGSDAMGGVINIITRKVASEWGGSVKLEGTVQMNSDFGNSYSPSIYLSGPIKEDLLGVSVYGSYQRNLAGKETYPATEAEARSGDFTGDISGNGFPDSKIVNSGIRFALTPNRNNDILLDIEHGSQRYDNSNGQLGELSFKTPAGIAGGGYETTQRYDKTRYGLSHQGRYGDLVADSSIIYETTETKGRTNPMSVPRLSTDGAPRKLQYDNLVLDSKWNWSLLDDTHNLTFGGQWREQKFQDGLVTSPLDLKQWQWALFIEDEWRIVENFALTLGARYDQNEQFGGNWSPRAYAVWNAAPQWTVKGGVARGYRAPDLNIMTDGIIGLRGQGTMPILGSSTLTPEKSTSSELGLYYDDTAGTRANITFFHTSFTDKLLSNTVPNCRANRVPGCLDLGNWRRRGQPVENFFRWENVDEATVRGVELGGSLPLTQNLVFSGNYTYTNAKRDSGIEAGQPLNSDPRHMLNMRLDWAMNEQMSSWVRGEYRAKQFSHINDQGTEEYYRPYWLVGVGGSYQLNKNVVFNASVENLFNKKFVDYGAYSTTGAPGWGNAYYSIQEGRRLWLSANITF